MQKTSHLIYVKDSKKPLDSVDYTKPGKKILCCSKTKKVLKVLTITGESKTDQSYKEITSVKSLVQQQEAQGLLRAEQKFTGELDDYPSYNFQEAQFMMAKAENIFQQLPSKIRNEFDGDSAKFMQFANDPQNIAKLNDMGLAKTIDGYDKHGKKIPIPPEIKPEEEITT